MSRYLILIILNAPFVIAAMMSAIVAYKLQRTSWRRLMISLVFWLLVLGGLVFAEPLYSFLFSHRLTQTEPLSLFDVIEITGVIVTLFIANRAYARVDLLERRVQDLHRELSIKLAQDATRPKH